ncbi:putative aminopeptidase [Arthrobacter sp. SO3]|nr:putative aminopeptidase [Arthrobacter sp. SO3]
MGTASVTLENGVVVGAIAVVNALGLPYRGFDRLDDQQETAADPEPGSVRLSGGHDGGVPWPSLRGEGAGGEERASTQRVSDLPPPLNTTLVVVATNAVLDKAECKRTASAAHAGLARALNPSHTLADGDTVFCLATGALALDRSSETARQVSLITLQSAAADVVRLAILDGIACAEAVSTPAGEFGAYGG